LTRPKTVNLGGQGGSGGDRLESCLIKETTNKVEKEDKGGK